MARTINATGKKNNLKAKMKSAAALQSRLRNIAVEPQHTIPDIFVWLIHSNRRIAYQRVSARDIMYSVVDEERGKDCGRVQTLFLRVRP
jgi:hypothetical protein